MRIDIERDDNRGGYFLVYIGEAALPFLTFYSGPFASRNDAIRATPEYKRIILKALETVE